MTENKIKKRDDFLKSHPAIEAIYQFQQHLYQLLMHKTLNRNKAATLVPELLESIQQLKNSPFKSLATLGNTLINGGRK